MALLRSPTISTSCRVSLRPLPSCRTFTSSARLNEQQPKHWGFIGLGQMGYRMALNLRKKIPASDKLLIQDVDSTALKGFMQETGGHGTQIAKDARQVAEESDIIITVLPSGAIVNSIFDTILASPLPPAPSASSSSTSKSENSKKNERDDSKKNESDSKDSTESSSEEPHPSRLYIDCSTISPHDSLALGAKIASHSSSTATLLDAPMSGGTVGAAAGTLTFMLGSPTNLVPTATSILSHMGRRILHLGDPGAGLCGKLANNYLLALNNIATAEAMNLGLRLGLDGATLAAMINSSTGKCWPSEVNNPVPGVIPTSPASRGYTGGFGVSLMKKDLGLAIEAAERVGVDMEKGLGGKARAIYDEVDMDEACKGKDFSVVYKWLGGKE